MLSRTIPAQSVPGMDTAEVLEYAYCGESPQVLAEIRQEGALSPAGHRPIRYLISLTPTAMVVWLYCCCGNRGSGVYDLDMSKIEALQDVWSRMSMFW